LQQEDEDSEFSQKLAELRLEVQKRDMMRKFEAIHNQQLNRKLTKGGSTGSGNPLMSTTKGGNRVTTDHNGAIIQVRSGAVAL